MNTQKRVFDKLFFNKQKFSANKKVNLALIDSAENVLSKYSDIEEDNAFSLAVNSEMEYKTILSEYKNLLSEINNVKPELEKAINELGVNRDNFGILEDLDNLEDNINERINIVTENIDLLLRVRAN